MIINIQLTLPISNTLHLEQKYWSCGTQSLAISIFCTEKTTELVERTVKSGENQSILE